MRERNLRPEDIRSQDDLHNLPLLSKEDVRKHLYFDIIQEGVSPADLIRLTTAGNTGEPLVCYVDSTQLDFRAAVELRAREWAGCRVGDPWVLLTAEPAGRSVDRPLRGPLNEWLTGRRVIPVAEMTEQKVARVADSIRRYEPRLIQGDAEVLDLLARFLGPGGLRGAWKAVSSSGQTLTPKTRSAIEAAFGCPVFDAYGSGEFSRFAHEAAARDAHLVAGEGYLVEVLIEGRPALPGEVGEVVITDLNAYAMPFLRYRIGDLAEVATSSGETGRGLPRLGQIQGRVQSILRGTDGRFIPGTLLARIVSDYDFAISRLEAVQHEPGVLTLKVVRGSRYADDILEEIQAILRRHLGPGLDIRVEFAEAGHEVPGSARIASISSSPVDLQRPGLRMAR